MKRITNGIREYTPVAFQKASIDAIVRHFADHDRALCADEAGLGKTIIARGVIEQMATDKVGDNLDEYKRALKDWFDQFCNNASSEELGANTNIYKKAALERFIKDATGKRFEKTERVWSEALSKYKDDFDKCVDSMESAEEVAKLLRHIVELYTYYIGTNKRRDDAGWNTSLKLLSTHSFKVLYVCCNLAVADQNCKKLTPVAQCSDRGSKRNADRLSILWYYLENYPTPYLDIYSITATVTTTQTKGNDNERNILSVSDEVSAEDFFHMRDKGEELSLHMFSPDLVIFDEFQNFTDMVNLIDMDDDAFEEYLNNPENYKDADASDESDKESDAFTQNRINSLIRCRKIVKTLFEKQEGKKPPKLLMLSATPFHLGKKENSVNNLEYRGLLKFMGLDPEEASHKSSEELEKYLYDGGIFRNERIRLMQKNNHSYHLIECSGEGLLSRAGLIKNRRAEDNTGGNRALGIVMTTPDLGAVKEAYGNDKYELKETQLKDLPPHSRYERLKDIIFAPHSNDVSVSGRRTSYNDEGVLKLLWIPPVNPSRPLQGVFAKYRDFSKTLVFSNLLVTPKSICKSLRKQHGTGRTELSEEDMESVMAFIADSLKSDVFGDEETGNNRQKLFEALAGYILRNGGQIFGEKTDAKTVCDYIESGCLSDVVKEYLELGYDADDLTEMLSNKSNYSDCLFYDMDQADLNVSDAGASVRKAFNSPFYPFVLVTTSIGAEGLDFHQYCERLVHYTAPANVVALEQKNGRIDRYGSLAQRKWWSSPGNVFAMEHGFKEHIEASGGMIPGWDAGEGNLHYYFMYTLYTSEKKELEELFKKQNEYRRQIGVNSCIEPDSLNLCPYCHQKL